MSRAVASPPATTPGERRTILVLQGGGALGSYQAGVFEGLAEAALQPDWIAGVSIGAINAAIIAGNPPDQRLARLQEFWRRITAPTAFIPPLPLPGWQKLSQGVGAMNAVMFGQPGFFHPRPPAHWLGSDQPVSYYDTSALRRTLEELVDFDRIAAGETRLSVGAVKVETGQMVYFDSARQRITADHVLASGALPPGFAAIEIDGHAYWDGGLVSNTPLQYVIDENPRTDSLVFQVDLFPLHGKPPANLDEVAERAMDIRYASRTLASNHATEGRHNVRRDIHRLLQKLPDDLKGTEVVARLERLACPARIDLVHMIYKPPTPQGAQKDFQFDRVTMDERWACGLMHARRSVAAAPWETPPPEEIGLRSFFVAPTAPHD